MSRSSAVVSLAISPSSSWSLAMTTVCSFSLSSSWSLAMTIVCSFSFSDVFSCCIILGGSLVSGCVVSFGVVIVFFILFYFFFVAFPFWLAGVYNSNRSSKHRYKDGYVLGKLFKLDQSGSNFKYFTENFFLV